MIFAFTQVALVEDDKILMSYSSIPMCRLTNHLIGIKLKLRGKYRNCYDSIMRTINTLEQSVKLNRRENMYCCYEDQLTGIMSTRLETNTNVWSPLGLSGGQREAPFRLGKSENTTTLFVNILCQKHTTESMTDLIDIAEDEGTIGIVTETTDVLSTTEKSGNELNRNYNMDSRTEMLSKINSLTINTHVDFMGNDREEEVKVIPEVAYTSLRDRSERELIDEGDGENISIGERGTDDRLLNKIINYTEHKMKDVSTDNVFHPNRLFSHVDTQHVDNGEDHVVRRGVVTD